MSIVAQKRDGPRVALYSHDTMGLGHTRRNMLIAQALAGPPLHASVLMITGIREAGAFAVPAGVDCLTLPAYRKDLSGDYHGRSLTMSAPALAKLRAQAIKAALVNFAPDIFIVDNVPRGALNELVPTLDHLSSHGRTQCVLGLRDVLDTPSVVRQQWLRRKNFDTIRNCYDAVWIYGDPAVYDTAEEYAFSDELMAKTSYTGYLDPAARIAGPPAGADAALAQIGDDELALCVLGGGQDGIDLAWNFAASELPAGMQGMILTGPFMPQVTRRRLAKLSTYHPRLSVVEFMSDPMPMMKRARSIVAMGGYNTVSEVLSLEKKGLLVPRIKPRKEQLIRAERLKALALLDYVATDELTPDRITDWLHHGPNPRPARSVIDFDGLGRISFLVEARLQPTISAIAASTGHGLQEGLRLVAV